MITIKKILPGLFIDATFTYEECLHYVREDLKIFNSTDLTNLQLEIESMIKSKNLRDELEIEGKQYLRPPDSWEDFNNISGEYLKAFFQNLYYDLFHQDADFDIDLVKDTKSYRLKSLLVKEGVFPESILYPENN